MPGFLTDSLASGPTLAPGGVVARLLASLVLGFVVAWIYRLTRHEPDPSGSFPATLVLLSILIAMVTQVIGDNVARAFSLVGALSIVRFRTVVRDTQDTAYVIFAVVVGMAVGAADLWVAGIGISVVGTAAVLMMPKRDRTAPTDGYQLTVRTAIGHEAGAALEQALDAGTSGRRVVALETARQGLSVDTTYDIRLPAGADIETLVRALNRLDGVQEVSARRRESAEI